MAPKGQLGWRLPLILLIGLRGPLLTPNTVLGCRGEADRAGREGGGSTHMGHRSKPQRRSAEPPLQPWPWGPTERGVFPPEGPRGQGRQAGGPGRSRAPALPRAARAPFLSRCLPGVHRRRVPLWRGPAALPPEDLGRLSLRNERARGRRDATALRTQPPTVRHADGTQASGRAGHVHGHRAGGDVLAARGSPAHRVVCSPWPRAWWPSPVATGPRSARPDPGRSWCSQSRSGCPSSGQRTCEARRAHAARATPEPPVATLAGVLGAWMEAVGGSVQQHRPKPLIALNYVGK